MLCKSAALALALTAMALPALASEHVVNGDFEDGRAGWDVTPAVNPWLFATGADFAHHGTGSTTNYCTVGDCLNESLLSQTVATTPGQAYDLSFWVSTTYNWGLPRTPELGDEQIRIFWNGAEVTTISYEDLDWTRFTVGGLVATGSSSLLTFGARNDPGSYFMDEVSLQDHVVAGPGGGPGAGGAPEPAAWALMIAGFGGTGMMLRRRRAMLRPA